MSRDLSNIILDRLEDQVVYPVFAVKFEFPSTTLRLWSGVGTLVYDGESYIGAGDLLSVSSIEETTDISPRGAIVGLSGLTTSYLTLALTEDYQGSPCTIFFGLIQKGDRLLQENSDFILLEDGSKIVLDSGQSDLSEIFSGFIDQMNIEESGRTSTLEVTVENKLLDLERPRIRRYSSGYQKTVYPDDLGFDFVERIQDESLEWKF